MKRLPSLAIAFGLLLLVLAILGAIKGEQINAMIESGESYVPPPETISVFVAEQQSWPQQYTAIGTVEADEGIMISAQVPGKVKRITFQSGAEVKAGDVLIEQEATNETAQLNAAQARLKLAKSSYQRVVELRRNKIASQSELDSAIQQVESAQGDVDDLSATLQKKLIRAPFNGRVGLRQIDLGSDLQVGTAIVSLQATNRVRVNFPVPQDWLGQMNTGLPVSVQTDKSAQIQGVITAIGAEINVMTRNVQVQSSLENADKRLMPGMAVNTTVTLTEPLSVLAVPTTAIIYAPYGDTVFVVDDNPNGAGLVARQQFVQLGQARGDFVEIVKGIQAGDRIVSAGAFKLFNNQAVAISTNPTPEFKTAPNPSDS